MAYPREILLGSVIPEGTFMTSAQSLTQAAAAYGKFHVRKPIVVQEISFHISTAVKDLTSSIVAAELVTNIQNATPVTAAIGQITIPNGATANTTYYNNGFTPVLCPANSFLQLKLKTQGGLGGTPAGAGFMGFYATFSPEENSNATPSNSMILVTT